MNNGSSPRLAVLYDRASTIGQRNNWSRDDAARFLDRVVADHGYQGEIRQEIKSGETLVNRPVMKALLEEIADGRVSALVCQDFSRLSRDEDGIDGRIIRQVCRDAGCLIITQEKVYDFENDGDDLLADIHFFVGKVHKRQSILALTRGLKEKARQGQLLPTYPPYGYEWSERWPDEDAPQGVKPGAKKPGAELVVVPEEADVVRRIFGLYEQMSQRQIAMLLNREGITKPVRSRGWRRKTQAKEQGQRIVVDRAEPRTERTWLPKDVQDIVANSLYAGLLIWGEKCTSRFMKDFEGVQQHRPDLQIVSLEQFNRCRRIIKERFRAPGVSAGSPYIFSGLIRCVHCGGRMVGKRQWEDRAAGKERHRRYECRAYHVQGQVGCRGQSVYENKAKQAVLPALVDLLENRLRLGEALREAANEMAAPSAGKRREEYTAELAKVGAAQERLVDAVAEGLLPADAIRRKQLDLMEKKEYVEKRLAALDRNRESTTEITQALQLVQTDLRSLLENAPEPQLARLCRLVYRKLTVEVDMKNGRTPKIESYEFTPELQDLLGDAAADWPAERPRSPNGGAPALVEHSRRRNRRPSTPDTHAPAWEIVWWGARKGRCVISGVSEGSRPLTL